MAQHFAGVLYALDYLLLPFMLLCCAFLEAGRHIDTLFTNITLLLRVKLYQQHYALLLYVIFKSPLSAYS